MKNKAWKVVWNEGTFGTYLYGSKIWFHSREDIEFENELMPPGTVIKEWYSKCDPCGKRNIGTDGETFKGDPY